MIGAFNYLAPLKRINWPEKLASASSLFLHLALAIGFICSATSKILSADRFPLVEVQKSPEGRFVYERNCATCHGVRGDGKGELGLNFKPVPRDFGSGIFKYRSTPAGFLPTDDDLSRTIREGISDTAMPGFATLSSREVRSVIQHVKTLSKKWRDPENYSAPILIPDRPDWMNDPKRSSNHVEKARSLFAVSCAPCHGPKGDGAGSVTNLVDSFGNPAPARDLRLPYIQSGHRLEDIYKVLVTGMDGTPMPSFGETIPEEQRWELVAFVDRLRQEHEKVK